VRLSPNLARIYRERVESLEQVLRDPQHGREAFELIRSLIEEVRLVPADRQLGIELKGELAGILALADGARRTAAPHQQTALQIKMVAGARSHLYRTDVRLDCTTAKARYRSGMTRNTAGPEL
jgi:site-specific DNA recombinase